MLHLIKSKKKKIIYNVLILNISLKIIIHQIISNDVFSIRGSKNNPGHILQHPPLLARFQLFQESLKVLIKQLNLLLK